jgi:phosphatidylcholine synthase
MQTITPLATEDHGRRAVRRGLRKLLAWGVHFYTALGLVAAAGIAVLIVRGDGEAFRGAFWLMLIATLVDATDGTLARLVKVKKVLPRFDGRKLDDLVDFLTYTFLPLFLIWRAGILPAGHDWCLLVPLLASAYGFCQVAAKTDDGYFLGFPSYWNLVAFYLYLLRPAGWLTVGILLGLALLTFVPSRYLYPTQRGRLNRLTNLLAAVWTGLLVCILYGMPDEPAGDDRTRLLALLSLFFPFYYLVASWTISVRFALRRHSAGSGP